MESMNTSPYENVDYICASAAEVEQLCLIAKHILSNSRSRMTPNLFEALVFLKVNNEYWDCRMVQDTYMQARKELRSTRVQGMVEEDENYPVDKLNLDAA